MTRYYPPLVVLAATLPRVGDARFVVSDRKRRRCLREKRNDAKSFVDCAYGSGRARDCRRGGEKKRKGKGGKGGKDDEEDGGGDANCARLVDEGHVADLVEIALELGMPPEDAKRLTSMMINSADRATMDDDEGEPKKVPCKRHETCSQCLENDCGWANIMTNSFCRNDCHITDVRCYAKGDGTVEEACSVWEVHLTDIKACAAMESCEECVRTVLPSDERFTCLWDGYECLSWCAPIQLCYFTCS